MLYMQQSLSGLPNFAADFGKWDWSFILTLAKMHSWGVPDNNLLLVGMKGARTPLHFDERENLFAQVCSPAFLGIKAPHFLCLGSGCAG